MLTSIQETLLSFSSEAFRWTFNDHLDGGIWNDIFTLNTSANEITFRDFGVLCPQGSCILPMVMRKLFEPNLENPEIGRWIPEGLGGGPEARFNDRVTVLVGLCLFIAVVLLLIALSVLVMSCNPCCCTGKKKRDAKLLPLTEVQDSPRISNYSAGTELSLIEKIHSQTLYGNAISAKSIARFRIYHGFVFVSTYLLIFAFLVMIFVYIYASSLVYHTLAETPTTPDDVSLTVYNAAQLTVTSAINGFFKAALHFLETSTITGNNTSILFIGATNETIFMHLKEGVSGAVQELLNAYGLRSLLDTGESLRKDVDLLQTEMGTIRKTNQMVSAGISNLRGQYNIIYQLVVPELNIVCASADFGPQMNSLCAELKANASVLIIHFNATAIEVEPPSVLNFLLNNLGFDLDAMLSQFSKVTEQIMQVEAEVLTKVEGLLDISSLFSPVLSIWQSLQNLTADTSTTLDKVARRTSTILDQTRPIAGAAVYVPAAIFGLLFIVATVVTLLFTVEACKSKLLREQALKFHTTGVGSSNRYRSSDTSVCNNCGYFVHAVLFVIFLVAIAAIVVLLLPASALVASSGCAYLLNTKGVAQSDYVFNSFITHSIWPGVLRQITASLGESTASFLVLDPPKNVIDAATVKCKPQTAKDSRSGLLGAVGWKSILDITGILNSQEINDKIANGEKVLTDEVVKLNLSSLIPNDLQAIASTARNLTNYFDNMDYSESIKQLSPNRIPVNDLEAYANSLDRFLSGITSLGLTPSKLLVRSVELIRLNIPKSVTVMKDAEVLRAAFQTVQNLRNLTTRIDLLLVLVEETRKTVSEESTLLKPMPGIYSSLVVKLKKNLITDLSPAVEIYTAELLPCDELYTTIEIALQSTCEQNGMLSRIFAWILSLAVTMMIATLVFFSIFHLFFIQSQQFRRLYLQESQVQAAVTIVKPIPKSLQHPESAETTRYVRQPLGPSAPVYYSGKSAANYTQNNPHHFVAGNIENAVRLNIPVPSAITNRTMPQNIQSEAPILRNPVNVALNSETFKKEPVLPDSFRDIPRETHGLSPVYNDSVSLQPSADYYSKESGLRNSQTSRSDRRYFPPEQLREQALPDMSESEREMSEYIEESDEEQEYDH